MKNRKTLLEIQEEMDKARRKEIASYLYLFVTLVLMIGFVLAIAFKSAM